MIHIILVGMNPQVILNPETRNYLDQGTFLGDGNDFALSVSIVIPMCLFLMLEGKKKVKKIFWMCVLLFLALCIVATSSRGGTVAMVCVFLYLWLKSRKKLLGVLTIMAFAAVVLVYAPPTYFQRMSTIKNYEEEESAKGRIMAWKSSVRMAVDHPFLGVGAGHFPVKYGSEYRPPGYGRTDLPWQNAHSIYFLVLGELGFPGIIFLLAILYGNLKLNENTLRGKGNLTRDAQEHNSERNLMVCMNASLIAFATGGAFLNAIYYPHLFVLCGLSESARNVIRSGYISSD